MLLHRINSARNERRFYYLAVQPWLLGEIAIVRVWGRIGGWQRVLVTPVATQEEADRLAARLVQRRLNNGYKLVDIPERRKR